MTNALRSPADYELFIYTLSEQFPQPHPDAPALQSSHPHHKHIPPDIKHHRLPAPQLSFTQPNLPALIGEIGELLKTFEESKL